MTVSGPDEHGFEASACQVELATGEVDTILYSAGPRIERHAAGGLRFAGRLGFWRERDGRPVAIALVGGTRLVKDRVGIELQQPEYRGRIVTVDRSTESVTVAPAPENAAALVGQYVFITNERRRVAYKVLAAERVPEGVELRLNWDSRIGIGRATGVKDGHILTDTPFPLQGYGYYCGARIMSADGKSEYRLLGLRSRRAVYLDRDMHSDADAERLAEQFPAGSWFAIYDYGIGDELVWPYAVSLTLEEPGRYRLCTPVAVKVRLPAGCTLMQTPGA